MSSILDDIAVAEAAQSPPRAEVLRRAEGIELIGEFEGSGFVEPYPRTEPAGPGGGAQGCVDPPL